MWKRTARSFRLQRMITQMCSWLFLWRCAVFKPPTIFENYCRYHWDVCSKGLWWIIQASSNKTDETAPSLSLQTTQDLSLIKSLSTLENTIRLSVCVTATSFTVLKSKDMIVTSNSCIGDWKKHGRRLNMTWSRTSAVSTCIWEMTNESFEVVSRLFWKRQGDCNLKESTMKRKRLLKVVVA